MEWRWLCRCQQLCARCKRRLRPGNGLRQKQHAWLRSNASGYVYVYAYLKKIFYAVCVHCKTCVLLALAYSLYALGLQQHGCMHSLLCAVLCTGCSAGHVLLCNSIVLLCNSMCCSAQRMWNTPRPMAHTSCQTIATASACHCISSESAFIHTFICSTVVGP